MPLQRRKKLKSLSKKVMRKRKLLISGTLKAYSDGSQGFNKITSVIEFNAP